MAEGNKRLTILVPSCDRYADVWRTFFLHFDRSWPDCPYPVVLGTNWLHSPTAKAATLAVGTDKTYAQNLAEMLGSIESEFVLTWTDDLLLRSRVDTREVDRSLQLLAASAPTVGYCKLVSAYPLGQCASRESMFGPIPRGTRYRLSLTVALWRRSTLSDLLRPEEDAWQIERFGSQRADLCTEQFWALTRHSVGRAPVKVINAIVKGKLTRQARRFLLETMPDSELLVTRRLESVSSAAYSWMYQQRLRVMDTLRLRWRHKGDARAPRR